jgi:hypothetical protein
MSIPTNGDQVAAHYSTNYATPIIHPRTDRG